MNNYGVRCGVHSLRTIKKRSGREMRQPVAQVRHMKVMEYGVVLLRTYRVYFYHGKLLPTSKQALPSFLYEGIVHEQLTGRAWKVMRLWLVGGGRKRGAAMRTSRRTLDRNASTAFPATTIELSKSMPWHPSACPNHFRQYSIVRQKPVSRFSPISTSKSASSMPHSPSPERLPISYWPETLAG